MTKLNKMQSTLFNFHYFSPLFFCSILFLVLAIFWRRSFLKSPLEFVFIYLLALVFIFGHSNPRYYASLLPFVALLMSKETFRRNRWAIFFSITAVMLATAPIFSYRYHWMISGYEQLTFASSIPVEMIDVIHNLPAEEAIILSCSAPNLSFFSNHKSLEYFAYSTYGDPRRGVASATGVDNVFNWNLSLPPLTQKQLEEGYQTLVNKYKVKWIYINMTNIERYPEIKMLIDAKALYFYDDEGTRLYRIVPPQI